MAVEERVSVDLEVPFRHVDVLQVVWHGHYLKYLEEARSKLLRARGIDEAELWGMGYTLYVVECKCRYVYPLRYRDRFTVSAWLLDVEHRICIAYEIWNQTHGRRSARARTVLVTLDGEGRMLLDTPEAVRTRLKL